MLFVLSGVLVAGGCEFDPSGLDNCSDECLSGQTRCSGTKVQTCSLGELSCYTWTDATDCAAVGLVCTDSDGGASCTEGCPCTPGQVRCSSDGASVEECRVDGDTCSWEVKQSCTPFGICTTGGGNTGDGTAYCQEGCNCTVGQTRCASDMGSIEECVQNGSACGWLPSETCGPGTICDDSTTAQCAGCVGCAAGEFSCTADYGTVLQCVTDAHGCTSWKTAQQCVGGEYCDAHAGSCRPCDSCQLGEKQCSDSGDGVLKCIQITASCTAFATYDSTCSVQGMEVCDDSAGSDPQCHQYGDTCGEVMTVPVPATLHFTDFSGTFNDRVTRVTDESEKDSFYISGNFSHMEGADAFFAVHLNRNETIRVTSSEKETFFWSLPDSCPTEDTAINYGASELVFGAPWDGTFVFGMETLPDATDITVTVSSATTVCDRYGVQEDEGVGPVTVDGTDTTVCLPVRRTWDGICMNVAPVPNAYLMAWVTSYDGRDSGGAVRLYLMDAGSNLQEVFVRGAIRAYAALGQFPLDIAPRLFYHFPAGVTSQDHYRLCIEGDNGGVMPYAAVHIRYLRSLPQAPQPGDMMVTEIMLNGADKNHNWVEFTNTTSRPFYLSGCKVRLLNDSGQVKEDNVKDDDSHRPFVLPGGRFLVVGARREAENWNMMFDSDMGAIKDAQDIGANTVQLVCGGQVIDEATVPEALLYQDDNRSVSLDAFAVSNDATDDWCLAPPVPYPVKWEAAQGFGTPGGANPPCDLASMQPVYDFDFVASCPQPGWFYSIMDDGMNWSTDFVTNCDADGVRIHLQGDDLTRLLNSPALDLSGYRRAVAVTQMTCDIANSSRVLGRGFRGMTFYPYYTLTDDCSGRFMSLLNPELAGNTRSYVYIDVSRDNTSHDAEAHVQRIRIYAW